MNAILLSLHPFQHRNYMSHKVAIIYKSHLF